MYRQWSRHQYAARHTSLLRRGHHHVQVLTRTVAGHALRGTRPPSRALCCAHHQQREEHRETTSHTTHPHRSCFGILQDRGNSSISLNNTYDTDISPWEREIRSNEDYARGGMPCGSVVSHDAVPSAQPEHNPCESEECCYLLPDSCDRCLREYLQIQSESNCLQLAGFMDWSNEDFPFFILIGLEVGPQNRFSGFYNLSVAFTKREWKISHGAQTARAARGKPWKQASRRHSPLCRTRQQKQRRS